MTRRFEDALSFAAARHADQTRKASSIPYVSHLLAVCSLVMENGGDEDEAIAALLHDAVEDQKATLDEISERFGGRVARIVDDCSDTDEEPKPAWRPRKEAFVSRIAGMEGASHRVIAADKLHNLRSIVEEYRVIGDQVWERFTGERDGTLWYYRAVTNAVRGGAPERMVAALDRELEALDELLGR